jgi:hypothetical protein
MASALATSAVSGLPEAVLLDAAHIVADKDERFGQPVVPNGIPLSKIHHAAFDAHPRLTEGPKPRSYRCDGGPARHKARRRGSVPAEPTRSSPVCAGKLKIGEGGAFTCELGVRRGFTLDD